VNSSIKGSQHPVAIDIHPESEKLYVFFGGIRAKIAMPPFEFYNSARILDENKIFIRDLAQCWYQAGLPGISRDIYSTADYIAGQISQINPHQTVFVGNSMGGFAALMFAALVGADRAIAFAPQTFISPFLRVRHRDLRWQKQILNTYFRSLFKRRIWDLKLLLKNIKGKPELSIYVSSSSRLDMAHAFYLEGLPAIDIQVLDSGGHSVVRVLRDRGQLPAILAFNEK